MNFYANILESKGPVIGNPYFLQTKEEIENWLKHRYSFKNYKINDDLTVDVISDYPISLSDNNLSKIPIKFNKIEGDFILNNNGRLESLKGCPEIVTGNFECKNCGLTSFEHMPKVGKNINVFNNLVKSFKGIQEVINGDFDCSNNDFISFKHMPKKITGKFRFINNNFKTLTYLSIFDNNIAYFLIAFYPKLSWLPIKDILTKVSIKTFDESQNKIINSFINLLKGKSIRNKGDFITQLYQYLEADLGKKHSDATGNMLKRFSSTILNDLEKDGAY